MKSDQLSQTAAFVAIKFYGLSRMPPFQTLFDERVINFYDRLVSTLPAPLGYYHYWLRRSWVRRLYIWSEELLLPGDLLHIVGRKWHLQQMTQQLVDKGYEQLIVLGAGFDHLAHHYAQHGIQCVEFDVPHMASVKRRFLEEAYPRKTRPSITGLLLPDDNLGDALRDNNGIHPHKKTAVVAEGFFDYLQPDTTQQVLQT
ncbi:MAG: class I SAM-dependent methyltransferase [Fodinibius sp.]|nr:class I SAM-dependent methyltransferase [Fodinibius sp.]